MENKKMRILIADDNKDFCDCLSNYISKQDDMENYFYCTRWK